MKLAATILTFLMLATTAHATPLTCAVTKINGETPGPKATAAFDPGLVLLDLNRGNGVEGLIGQDALYLGDAAAIWFDRAKDCHYHARSLGNGTIRHEFVCGTDVTARINVLWDRSGSEGTYEQTLSVQGLPDETFTFDFQNCANRPLFDDSTDGGCGILVNGSCFKMPGANGWNCYPPSWRCTVLQGHLGCSIACPGKPHPR